MDKKEIKYLWLLVAITTLVLLFFSSLRLYLFGAGLDLGFFNQLLYLVSQGLSPVSSLLEGTHLIGDHAAFILYPLSLFYFIYPNIHWLLLIQAFALALGAIPVYALSRENGLSISYSRAIAISYILYPAIFNINFYTEFRPETIAVPALLWAAYAVQKNRYKQVLMAMTIVLSCKEIMSFVVIGFGFYLLVVKKSIKYGIICILGAALWFLVAAIYIIPTFRGGHPMAGTWYYSSLGNSLSELVVNLITNPLLILQRTFAVDRLFYYLLLILPIIIGLSLKKIIYFIPALPSLFLNILSDDSRVRDLIHQYSLPIIPFLFVWFIYSLANIKKHQKRPWLSPRLLITWSIITFLSLAKYGYFYTRYFPLIPYNNSVRQGIKLIPPQARVLTSSYIANHLSQRTSIHVINMAKHSTEIELSSFDYILISLNHLERPTTPENAQKIIETLSTSEKFSLIYQDNNTYLFQQKPQETHSSQLSSKIIVRTPVVK